MNNETTEQNDKLAESASVDQSAELIEFLEERVDELLEQSDHWAKKALELQTELNSMRRARRVAEAKLRLSEAMHDITRIEAKMNGMTKNVTSESPNTQTSECPKYVKAIL